MSEGFKLEIVNPEKSFLSKDGVSEVVVPAFEGDMGILKDHISIISFLRPGLLRIIDSKSSEETYYVEDGIIEFKNNCLSILTSYIFDIKKTDKNKVRDILVKAEKE
jgi:F-type H+-transporting ATPase subunit epsilon/F-type H+-transporting ATPase subunit delta